MNTLYRDPDGNIHTVSDECPKGFKGVLFVGHDSDGVEKVYAANVLQKWERIENPQPEPTISVPQVQQASDIELEFAPWEDIPFLDVTDPASITLFIVLCIVFFIIIRPFFLI